MKLKKWKEINHKEKGIILFTILSLFLIVGVFFYQSFAVFQVSQNQNLIEGNIGSMGDIEFAYYLDGAIVSTAPEKNENYTFDDKESSCTNGAIINWNYQVWAPLVLNLKETKTKCNLKFKTEYSEAILEGAVPELKESLVPIIIEENTGVVKKADIKSQWYRYGEQKWANAVITGNSYDLLGSNVHDATKENGYVHLDGQDDYINLGLANYEFQNQLTLSVSFTINTLDRDQNILSNTEGGGVGIYIDKNRGIIDNKYHIMAEFYQPKGYTYLWNDAEVILGQEYNVILKFNNGTLDMYVNGQKVKTKTSLSNYGAVKTPFLLGANPTGNADNLSITSPADINVKQAAIFNRAINENEIVDISNGFKITNSDSLLKYVDFTNKTYEPGEVISEDNIESYFVWIPRYRYQIWNGEKETSTYTSVTSLGEITNAMEKSELNKQIPIRIEFENKNTPTSKNTTKGEYLTHPAFTTFDTNGLWVGKFETGYKGANSKENAQVNEQKVEKVIIKPNVYSWRNINISNAFNTSLEYHQELESHMMKNTEWGAVAYLTNSKYGRCKDNECEEVRINNNDSYITGYSSKTKPTCGYTETNEECNKYGGPTTLAVLEDDNSASYYVSTSKASSTTGNYTGIYDMVGGAWEYVMGVMKDQNNKPLFETVGFSEIPNEKYYDLYEYNTSMDQYQRGILGDATKEVGPFYSVQYQKQDGTYGSTRYVSSYNADLASFVFANVPWFGRGGSRINGTDAGMFAFGYNHGKVDGNFSFRIVLAP